MLQYSQILAELSTALASFEHASVKISEDTDLRGDLELDSLQVMNLLLHVEDRFDISIPVSILPDVKTLKDLALQIESLTREG